MAEVAELRSDGSGDDDEEITPWTCSCESSSDYEDEVQFVRRTRRHGYSGGGEGSAVDSDIFVPIFSPHFQYISSHPLDREVPSGSDYESSYVEDDQVTLPLDLLERSSPRLDDDDGGGGGGTEMDIFPNSADPLDFGVLDGVEDLGPDYLPLGLGLGFGIEKPKEEGEGSSEADVEGGSLSMCKDLLFRDQWQGVWASGHADDKPSSSREGQGLRIVGFGSDSDSDEEVEIASNISLRYDGGRAPETTFDDMHLPIPWNNLRLVEDRRDLNEDLDWEEVEERLNEREILSVVIDSNDGGSVAQPEESEDFEISERGEDSTIPHVEWEILLSMNNLERIAPAEYEGVDEDHTDFGYTSENEILFEQFAALENFIKGSPPAAKLVIEQLPSIVLTQSDMMNGNTLCAVCKDDISLEENPKQLPCSHHYHAECILPWLRIRNTCPVCRYELPTDDPDYEHRRAFGAVGGIALDPEVMYEFGI